MLTNRQMFDNHIHSKHYQDEVEDHDHSIFHVPGDHTFFLFILFFIIIVYLIFYEITYDFFSVFFGSSIKTELSHFEDLSSFYYTLSNKNLMKWVYEENLVRRKFGYKKLFDSTYNTLRKVMSVRGIDQNFNMEILQSKGLFDIAKYDPLAMSNYYEELGYLPVDERNPANHEPEDVGFINDTKRVFDFPYFSNLQTIHNLFSASNNASPKIDSRKQDFEKFKF